MQTGDVENASHSGHMPSQPVHPVSRLSPMVRLETVDMTTFSRSNFNSSTVSLKESLLSPSSSSLASSSLAVLLSSLPPRSASAPPSTTAFSQKLPHTVDFTDTQTQRHTFSPKARSTYPRRAKPHELLPPPPSLCEYLRHQWTVIAAHVSTVRPTTFWRNTTRSGVTGASYSPSFHLIRRSTFIAAGLSLDYPVADQSAFGVESRIGVIHLPPDGNLAS